jgi:hypothetical protein
MVCRLAIEHELDGPGHGEGLGAGAFRRLLFLQLSGVGLALNRIGRGFVPAADPLDVSVVPH